MDEKCDFCEIMGLDVKAKYDGKTLEGPWAYMCEPCASMLGVGPLTKLEDLKPFVQVH